jgi:hypothetical protein
VRRCRDPELEALVDAHPLVRAADARVREALEVVMAGAPVRIYGDALMVWLDARHRARAGLRGRVDGRGATAGAA